MASRQIDYKCSGCGQQKERDDLTVKRVSFQTMGIGFKTIRSRVTDWLCESCRNDDPAWVAPRLTASPGLADTKVAHGAS